MLILRNAHTFSLIGEEAYVCDGMSRRTRESLSGLGCIESGSERDAGSRKVLISPAPLPYAEIQSTL